MSIYEIEFSVQVDALKANVLSFLKIFKVFIHRKCTTIGYHATLSDKALELIAGHRKGPKLQFLQVLYVLSQIQGNFMRNHAFHIAFINFSRIN